MLLTGLLKASISEPNISATLLDNSPCFQAIKTVQTKCWAVTFWIWMNLALKAPDDVLDCAKCTWQMETVGQTSSRKGFPL